jgi:multimeric flavodoxin WrbA
MSEILKVLAINGSYRDNGITDQAVNAIAAELQKLDAEVEQIHLREYPIEFCHNCRVCMQSPGDTPGSCVIDDGMRDLVEKIEQADAYILAAPTNFYTVTAVFKRFVERLSVYAYWPWGKNWPSYRKAGPFHKPAVLVSSCAAPGLLGRLTYGTHKELKTAARTIGARTVGSMFTGLISSKPEQGLPLRAQRKARQLTARLV